MRDLEVRAPTGGGAELVEVIHSLGLAWVPIRKAGTTSVRRAFRALAAGPGDLRVTDDRPMSAYVRWRAGEAWRFAVIRDPVERFLSAYSNRLLHHRDMTATATHRAITRLSRLAPEPDIEEFCDRFGRYMLANDILRRHFRLQGAYLGGDLGWFDGLYPLGALDRLAADLSERAGREVRFERLQTGGPKLRLADVPPRAQDRIREITAPDYALLRDWFAPP